MDDLQAGFGGKVYDVADLFQKPIIAQFEKQFSDMSVMDVAGCLLYTSDVYKRQSQHLL